jgi:short repeat uncharacterized protein DUF308
MRGDVDAVEPGVVQALLQPPRELGGANTPASPRQIDGVDAPDLCEPLEQRRPPAPGTAEAVHEDERFAAADDHLARSLHAKRTMTRTPAGGNLRGVNNLSLSAAGRPATREQAADVWWLFLVIGVLWLVFALLVFQVDASSVHGIAILTGIVCIAGAGLEFLSAATVHGGWRIVRLLLGAAFVVIGVLAFVHPQNTFSALATIFAFYLLLSGLFQIAWALVEKGELWWLRLVAGLAEVLLAFWAAGNFGHKAFLLIVWVGAGALIAGISQISYAFELRAHAGPADA